MGLRFTASLEDTPLGNRLSRWTKKLLQLPFDVEFRGSKLICVSGCLSCMYNIDLNKELEGNESVVDSINIVRGESQTHNVVVSALTVLTSVNKIPRAFPFENDKKDYIKLIKDIPLALTSIEKHQSTDPECIRIINSISNKTNNQSYVLKNDVLLYKKAKK